MVVLRYLEDLSVEDVARILGVREGAVRSGCHRALGKLRKAQLQQVYDGGSAPTGPVSICSESSPM